MNDALRAQDEKRRVITWFFWGLMILSPYLLLGMISLVIKENAFMAYPCWSDELDYWRTLYNWLHVGLQSGYDGMFETFAASGTLGVHGATAILLYGWFAKLFGLDFSTILLANAVWISFAALVFCLLHKPKPIVALCFAGLLILYAPIVLYCTTSMTELFNYALLLFYLAFLVRYRERRNPIMLALCCLTVIFACLYRITYFLLFIPLVLVFADFHCGWRMWLMSAFAALASALCYLLTSQITAPYAQGFLYNLVRADGVGAFFQMLLSHTKANLMDYFNYTRASVSEYGFRVLYCGVMLLCLGGTFFRFDRNAKKLCRSFQKTFFVCFLLLFLALSIDMVLYETNDWSDYRTLAPFLWLVVAFWLMRGRLALPSITLAANAVLVALLFFVPTFGAYADLYRFERPPYDSVLAQALYEIPYDPDAKNPLTNTVRIDALGLQSYAGMTPGLGFQTGWFTTDTTGKSNWILTDHLKCLIEGYDDYHRWGAYQIFRLIEPYEEQ
ncbi:MAG: hypothetical protein RSA65_01315 [Clostridia bacterium]